MKIIHSLCLVIWISMIFSGALNAEGRLEKRIDKCVLILDEVMQIPEESIPGKLLSKCSAIAIFPGTIKGGFVWGGRYGQGVMLSRDFETGTWSPPAFFTIGEVSWGLQIGAEAVDFILVIFGQNAVRGLLGDSFTLGADVAVAAGPVGRDAEANMDLLLKGGILSYSRAKGLFAGAAVSGAVITQNNVANRSYYGRDITPEEILIEQKVSVPESSRNLIDKLTKYSGKQ